MKHTYTRFLLAIIFIAGFGAEGLAQTELLFGKRGKGTTIEQEYLFRADTTGGIDLIGSDSLITDYLLTDSSVVGPAVWGLFGMSLNPISNEMYVVYGISANASDRRLGILNITDATIEDIALVGRITDITFMDNVLYGTTGQNHPDEFSLVTIDQETGEYTFVKDHLHQDNSNAIVFDYFSQRFIKSTQFTPRLDNITPIDFVETNLLSGSHPGWTTGLAMADSTTMIHVGNTRINTMDLTTYTWAVDTTLGADRWWHSVAFTEYPLSLWVDGERDGCTADTTILTVVGAPDGATYQWYRNDTLVSAITGETYDTDSSGVYYALVNGIKTNDVELRIGNSIFVDAFENLFCADAVSEVTLNGTPDYGSNAILWDMGVTNGVPFTPPVGTTTYTGTIDGETAVCEFVAVITVDTIPDVIASVNDSIVCDGDAVIFSAINAAEYTWDVDSLVEGVPYTTEFGTTVFTVTGTNGLCSATDDVEIVINELPNVQITIDESICIGDSSYVGVTGADSYVWADTSLHIGDTLILPIGTYNYVVTGTDLEGCVNVDSLLTTVYELPAVSGATTADTICNGSSVLFLGAGAVTYAWNNGVVNGEAFTPSAEGTEEYTVIGTDEFGCQDMDTVSLTVTENTLAVTSEITIESIGGDGAIDITVTGGTPDYSYDWDTDELDDFDDTEDVADLIPGIYIVVVRDAEGCLLREIITVDSELGIDGLTEKNISVYPNPTAENITVTAEGEFTYEVMGANGAILFTGIAVNSKEVSLEDFASGVYFVRVNAADKKKTIRVVKN